MDVTLPNGRVIQGVPDGTTKAQVMEKAIAAGLAEATDFGDIAPPEGGSVADPLAQGLSFGLSDEISGVLGAIPASFNLNDSFADKLSGIPDAYRGIRDAARENNAAFSERNPKTALAANLAGGLATGGAGLTRAGVNTVSGLAKSGAAAGAVGGFGASEGGVGEHLAGTATGAAVGGALAPALPALGGALSRLTSRPNQANSRFAELMKRDDMTPEQLQAKLTELGPEATIVDAAGPNVKASAEAIAQMPGRGQQLANELVNTRQAGQADRIGGALDDALGNGQSLFQAEQSIAQNLRTQSAPLYQQAYQQPITLNSEIRGVLNTPAGKNALGRAQEMAANEGEQFAIDAQSGIVPTKMLDYLKRGLDDIVETNTDSLTGATNNQGRIVGGLARSLRDEMDKQNPIYQQARAVFGGEKANQVALKEGQRFLRENAERTEFNMAGKSESEREMFRLGAMQSLRDRVMNKSDTADSVKTVFNSPGLREKIKAIVPDEDSFNALAQKMEAESEFFRTNNQLLGNSATMRRQQAAQDGATSNVLGRMLEGMTGNPVVSGARAALGRAAQSPEARSEPVRDLLSEHFFSSHPAVQQQLMQGLLRPPQAINPALGAPIGAAPAISQDLQGRR